MKSRARHAPQAGFTLVELMVALTIGGIAISSIYAIGAGTTRVFREQGDVANAQATLRMAMDQVKRDIARAGYLGTPNGSLPSERCGATNNTLHNANGSLAAISNFRNNVPINVANQNQSLLTVPGGTPVNQGNGFTADEIVLFGNYSTTAEYPILRDVDSSDRVIVQQGFYDFRRDFTQWWASPMPAGGPPYNQPAFDEAFTVGRAVGLRRPNGEYRFDTITAIQQPGFALGELVSPLMVQLASNLPAECADVAYISPLNAIRYFVRDAFAEDDAARFPEASGPVAQLFRMEVLPGPKNAPMNFTGTARPDRRAVLDYVVAFNLAFTMAAADADGYSDADADAYVVGSLPANQMVPAATVGSTTNVESNVTGSPERVRAVSIDLATRTPQQDPRFPWDASLCAQMGCFRVFDDRPGAARVRKLRGEVFLPNVAGGGY